jgi:hypothetical protein
VSKPETLLILEDLKEEADVEVLIIHHYDSDESRIVAVTAGRSQTDPTGLFDCKIADITQKIQPPAARNPSDAGREETVEFPLAQEDLIR